MMNVLREARIVVPVNLVVKGTQIPYETSCMTIAKTRFRCVISVSSPS